MHLSLFIIMDNTKLIFKFGPLFKCMGFGFHYFSIFEGVSTFLQQNQIFVYFLVINRKEKI